MLFSRASLVLALTATSFASSLEKRSTAPLSGVLCGIGLLNSCGATVMGINTASDPSNCGSVGFVCPADVFNSAGTSTCVAGTCTVPCASGYSFSATTGGCVNTAYFSDPANCGSTGTVCGVANGTPQCVAGSCTVFTCASGFTLVTNTCQQATTANDLSNCGALGYTCPVVNGASTTTCVAGKCTIQGCASGFVFALNSCNAINLNTDPTNCGKIGVNCGANALCNVGVCTSVNCAAGSSFNPALNACQDVSSSITNCGAIGNACATSASTVTKCVNSQCVTSKCTTPFRAVNNACTLPPSAAAVPNKRSKLAKRFTVCPGTETACPIVGSASFLLAQAGGFSNYKSADPIALSRAEGYECLDTTQSLESCGGCASMGEGTNCLAIPHVGGVGCENSVCVVLSCADGFKLNLTKTSCISTRAIRARRGNAKALNHVVAHQRSH